MIKKADQTKYLELWAYSLKAESGHNHEGLAQDLAVV